MNGILQANKIEVSEIETKFFFAVEKIIKCIDSPQGKNAMQIDLSKLIALKERFMEIQQEFLRRESRYFSHDGLEKLVEEQEKIFAIWEQETIKIQAEFNTMKKFFEDEGVLLEDEFYSRILRIVQIITERNLAQAMVTAYWQKFDKEAPQIYDMMNFFLILQKTSSSGSESDPVNQNNSIASKISEFQFHKQKYSELKDIMLSLLEKVPTLNVLQKSLLDLNRQSEKPRNPNKLNLGIEVAKKEIELAKLKQFIEKQQDIFFSITKNSFSTLRLKFHRDVMCKLYPDREDLLKKNRNLDNMMEIDEEDDETANISSNRMGMIELKNFLLVQNLLSEKRIPDFHKGATIIQSGSNFFHIFFSFSLK